MSISEIIIERSRMLKDWERYVRIIASAAKEILPNAKVYVFGSAVSGKAVASSDVDLLIVVQQNFESYLERAKIKALIEEKSSLPHYHPFEIHLVTEDEAEPYLRRAKKMIEL